MRAPILNPWLSRMGNGNDHRSVARSPHLQLFNCPAHLPSCSQEPHSNTQGNAEAFAAGSLQLLKASPALFMQPNTEEP